MSAIKDGTLDSDDLHALKSVYQELLGLDERSSIEMPFTVSEFKAIKLSSVLYGSSQSQTPRNSFILANWAGTEGSLAASTECDDLRPGQILTFFRHHIKVKSTLMCLGQPVSFQFKELNPTVHVEEQFIRGKLLLQ